MPICCYSRGGFAAALSCSSSSSSSSFYPSSFSGWRGGGGGGGVGVAQGGRRRAAGIRVSMVDSQGSTADFAKRMERAWLISKQPGPVMCSSCNSKGYVECKWCQGTGFFIIGDNILCEVPSRNTSCVICAGKGSACCTDCKGTGFRAKWLGQPPSSRSAGC